MSRQTTNYGLTKPDYTDIADIEVVNANMDIIDEALKVIDTKAQNVMSKNSSAWSSTVAYAVGQYCIYNNSLWKCLVQHSGQTPQEGTYWTRVSLDTLDSEISAINQNLSKGVYLDWVSDWNITVYTQNDVRIGDKILISIAFVNGVQIPNSNYFALIRESKDGNFIQSVSRADGVLMDITGNKSYAIVINSDGYSIIANGASLPANHFYCGFVTLTAR